MVSESQLDSGETVEENAEPEDEHERAEALTNGIYGTIIMTAFFVAIEEFEDSAAVLLGELLFATLVLFIAHLFSSWIGAETAADRDLSLTRIWGIIRAQLPLVLVVAVPSLFLVLAEAGVFSTAAAIKASLFFGMFLLFCVSFLLAMHHDRGIRAALVYGLLGAGMGAAVVGLEAALH